MTRTIAIAACAALGVLLGAAPLHPAFASCADPRIFPAETLFVCTPGVHEACGGASWTFYAFPYHSEEWVPLVNSLEGVFWALGSGDPEPGAGNDSGTWIAEKWIDRRCALFGCGQTGCFWACTPPAIEGDWSGSPSVDGCIDLAGSSPAPDPLECMALLLGDQNGGKGFFALITGGGGEPFDLRGRCFAETASEPGFCWAQLARIPAPAVSRVVSRGLQGTDLLLRLPGRGAIDAGLFLDPLCDPDPLVGLRIYRRDVPPGAPAPVDRRVAAGWTEVTREPLPPGRPVGIRLACDAPSDVYLAASLVFDSGFETPYLSASSPAVRCAGRIRPRPELDLPGVGRQVFSLSSW